MIDQEYGQLQAEFQDVAKSVQGLAEKMQAQADDTNAKEWLLDLKQIALDIRDEQMQVNSLLQAIHEFVQNAASQMPVQQAPAPTAAPAQPAMGGMFGGLLHGGFGQAMVAGAGIGIGDNLINSIFN